MNRSVRFLFLSLSLLLWPVFRQLLPAPITKAAPAMAAFTVNTEADTADADLNDGVCADANGNCSLRAAISQANALPGADTITLPAGTYTQTLVAANEHANAGGDWDITSNLTIVGAGAETTILQAAATPFTAAERVLDIVVGVVELRDLTVRHGNISRIGPIDYGGGIKNQGNLTLQRVVVAQNAATALFGGGIGGTGRLTLVDCTITGNLSSMGGGGVFLSNHGTFTGCTINGNSGGQGGGINFEGRDGDTLRMANCTVSDNTAGTVGGGGIYNIGITSGMSILEVVNCTIAGNNAVTSWGAPTDDGGGIVTGGWYGGNAVTTLRNTLVAHNSTPNLKAATSASSVTSLGHNLTTDDGNGFLTHPNDLSNTDPQLGPLADNGGLTQTRALLSGSPALNAGDNCVLSNNCATNNLDFTLTNDQRGTGFNRQVGGAVDIGAYEGFCSPPFTVNTTADTPDANLNDGLCADANGNCSLRAALNQANAKPLCGPLTITLPAGTYTQTLVAAQEDANAGGDWDIASNVTILGADAATTILQAATTPNSATERVLHVVSGTVELRNLTIRHGKSSGSGSDGGGGGLFNRGNLSLARVVVSQNNGGNSGGGIGTFGSLTLTDCTISGNQALIGGGVSLTAAEATFTDCTINGNTASSQGGGINFMGEGQMLQMANCTISNNSVSNNGLGAGLTNIAVNDTSTVDLVNCTLAGNTSTMAQGGGIRTYGSGQLATTRLRNTLLANNTAPNLRVEGSGTLISLGHNLTSDDGGGLLNAAGDLINSDPQLSALGNYGGPTQTHALPPGSLALEHGDNCVLTNTCANSNLRFSLTTDQRGTGFPRQFGTTVDIGAYEGFLCPTAFAVNTTADTPDAEIGDGLCRAANGSCSLRAALTQANATPSCSAFTIQLPAGTYTQTLVAANEHANAGGDWDIQASLTLIGAGAGTTILQAAEMPGTATERVLEIRSGTVEMRDLTVRYGKLSDYGAGLFNWGSLTLQRVVVEQNVATGFFGGGLTSFGPLTLTDCSVTENRARSGGGLLLTSRGAFTGSTISGNTASHSGGGIHFWAEPDQMLRLLNCTVSGNAVQTDGLGGGIYYQSVVGNSASTLEIIHSTIADNTSTTSNGGGLRVESLVVGNRNQVWLRNSILANNTGPNLLTVANSDGTAIVNSLGHNLTSDDGGGLLTQPTDLLNTNPLLDALALNSGVTRTRALLPGSPALNAGDNCVLTDSCASRSLGFELMADQRGLQRQVGSAVDIGAFESRGFTLMLASGNNQSTPVTQPFAQPLIVQVSSSVNEPVIGGVVTFSAPGSGPSANLSPTAAVIAAQGLATVNAVANLFPGAYQVTAGGAGLTPVVFNLANSCGALALSPSSLPGGTVGASYAQALSVSGAFGGAAAFTVSGGSLPPGLTLVANGALAGVPTTVGSFNFTVKATDTLGCFGTQSFTVNIACAPLVLSPASLANAQAGVAFAQSLSATGSGARTFSLAANPAPPAWLSLTPNGLLSGTPNVLGSFSFVVNVSDAQGCTGAQSYTLVVGCPTLALANLAAATAGTAYSAQLVASPSGGNFQFSSANKPAWLTLTSSGGLSGTPPSAGSFSFSVTVTGFGTCTQTLPVTLVVNCPTVTLTPAQLPNASLGASYSATVTASPAGTTYSYLLLGSPLPPGLSLDSATGLLSGTPTAAGNYAFVITALGWGDCRATQTYNLLVTATCPTVSLTPSSLAGGTVGTAYSQNLTANGATGPFTWTVTSGSLPAGLTLTSAGSLSGTPTAAGSFSFTVTATNGSGCAGSQGFTLSVACPTLTLEPASLTNATAGVAYNQSFTLTPSGAATFSLATGSLPPGLSLSASGSLSGTATATGSYSFSVKAERGSCSVTKAYTLVVTCPTVAVNPASLPNGSVGAAYNQSLSATPSGSYSFVVSSGSLPAGLSLSTAGVLSGTPTASGTFTFTARATAFGSCAGTRNFTLTIAAACATITLPSLANGAVSANYYGDLSATTPSGSYTFSLTSGSLPPGLAIDNLFGALTGTPTAAGTFAFTLQAANANGCSGTRAYSFVVSNGAAARAELADYDGDGASDPALWSAADGVWRVQPSSGAAFAETAWGGAGDVTLLGDYDGDGRTDLAVFRPSNATWYVKRSSDGQALVKVWGQSSDVPVPGDYDGDGRTDFAVWRGKTGEWLIQRSSDGQSQTLLWGSSAAAYQDVPVTGDFDGDGQTDLAVFRRTTGTWLIKRSSDEQFLVKAWGYGTDTPVAADYDGDGQTDIAVWRGATGEWFVLRSSDGGFAVTKWGGAAYQDVPVAGDYDGDGVADLTVWRAPARQWFIQATRAAAAQVVPQGQASDVPVTARR